MVTGLLQTAAKGLIAGAGLFEEYCMRTSDMHRPVKRNTAKMSVHAVRSCSCCARVASLSTYVPWWCHDVGLSLRLGLWSLALSKYIRSRLKARISFLTENMAALITRLRSGGTMARLMESIDSSSPSGAVEVEHTRRRHHGNSQTRPIMRHSSRQSWCHSVRSVRGFVIG